MNEETRDRNEIFSRAVKAGKRTYFFDVKSTRAGELYLTLTESKKRFNVELGQFFYEKHKVFLYAEDFDKFTDGLNEVIDFIKVNNKEFERREDSYKDDRGINDGGEMSDE